MQRYNSMAGDVKLAREMMFKEIPNRPRLSLPLSDVIQLKVRYLKARSSGSLPCGRGEDTGVCRDVVPCRFLRVNRHTAEVHRIHCLHRDIRPHIALVRSRFRWVQNILWYAYCILHVDSSRYLGNNSFDDRQESHISSR